MSLQEDAKRILPFVQAMAEGKTVQVMIGNNWIDKESATFDSVWILRIKPDKKWRPYTRDELLLRVGSQIRHIGKSDRFILVAADADGLAYLVVLSHTMDEIPLRLCDDSDEAFEFARAASWDVPEGMGRILEFVAGIGLVAPARLLAEFEFLDGSPCGVEVDE